MSITCNSNPFGLSDCPCKLNTRIRPACTVSTKVIAKRCLLTRSVLRCRQDGSNFRHASHPRPPTRRRRPPPYLVSQRPLWAAFEPSLPVRECAQKPHHVSHRPGFTSSLAFTQPQPSLLLVASTLSNSSGQYTRFECLWNGTSLSNMSSIHGTK